MNVLTEFISVNELMTFAIIGLMTQVICIYIMQTEPEATKTNIIYAYRRF